MNELVEKAVSRISNDMAKTSEPSSEYAIKAEAPYEVSEGKGNFNTRPVDDITEDVAPMSNGDIRDIKIVSLNSGFLVKVGCQSLAVEKTETLLARLSDYLTNPYEFEKKWFSNNNRNKLDNF